MAEIRIGVVGCAGRMGRMLVRQIDETAGATLAGGIEVAGNPALGRDIGELAGIGPAGLAAGDDPQALFAAADVVLEFTDPAATAAHAALAAQQRTAHVIGTTGLTAEHAAAIAAAAAEPPGVKAGNMSLGVNLLVQITRQVAAALGVDFDVEVVEMHHRHKVDAPSGTALMLGRAAAAGLGVEHDAVALRGRDAITGERPAGAIGYAALRGGNVVGEHTVIFAADNERIELTHKAADRAIFARGAVRAALWTAGKPAGLYDMADVLGLKT